MYISRKTFSKDDSLISLKVNSVSMEYHKHVYYNICRVISICHENTSLAFSIAIKLCGLYFDTFYKSRHINTSPFVVNLSRAVRRICSLIIVTLPDERQRHSSALRSPRKILLGDKEGVQRRKRRTQRRRE